MEYDKIFYIPTIIAYEMLEQNSKQAYICKDGRITFSPDDPAIDKIDSIESFQKKIPEWEVIMKGYIGSWCLRSGTLIMLEIHETREILQKFLTGVTAKI